MGCNQSSLVEEAVIQQTEAGRIPPDNQLLPPRQKKEKENASSPSPSVQAAVDDDDEEEQESIAKTSTTTSTTTKPKTKKTTTTNDNNKEDVITKFLMEHCHGNGDCGIFIEIFQWLDVRDLVVCGQVSRVFHDLLLGGDHHHHHHDTAADAGGHDESNWTNKNFLWFLLYCSKYRSQFAPPPTFEELIKTVVTTTAEEEEEEEKPTTTNNNTASSETNLRLLKDNDIQWKQLAIKRELSSKPFFLTTIGGNGEVNDEVVRRSRGDFGGASLRVAPSSSSWASPSQETTTAITTTSYSSSSSNSRLDDVMLNVLHKCPTMVQRHRGGGGGFGYPSCLVLEHHVRDMALPLSSGGRKITYVELYVRGGASCGLVSKDWEFPTGHGGTPRQYKSHVGWLWDSIGYHGDSGSIFFCSDDEGDCHVFGPTFGFDPELVQENNNTDAPVQPDVIGMGVDFGGGTTNNNNTLFYTKNGTLVGTISIADDDHDAAIYEEDLPYYNRQEFPYYNRRRRKFADLTYCYFAVCLHDREDFCSINFGTRRFVFDVEKYSQLPPPPQPTLQL